MSTLVCISSALFLFAFHKVSLKTESVLGLLNEEPPQFFCNAKNDPTENIWISRSRCEFSFPWTLCNTCLTSMMKFLSCLCFKRQRSTSDPISYDTHPTKRDSTGLVTNTSFQPLPDDIQVESDYQQVSRSSGDGVIPTTGSHRNSVGSINNGPYARVKYTEPSQTPFDDASELYATVDKNRASRFNASAAAQQRLPSTSPPA